MMQKISQLILLTVFLIISCPIVAQEEADTTNYPPADSTMDVSLFIEDGLEISELDTVNGTYVFYTAGRNGTGMLITDSPIVRALDSMTFVMMYKDQYFSFDEASVNNYNFAFDEVPVYPDSVYAARIALLNLETPMELSYNKEVKAYIDLYAVKKRKLTAKFLGLSELYFPMFEEALANYDIPLEMKYLAIVESALNPEAGSKAGAKGLWQFMYGTGKVYGLKVSSLVDDRFDPYKSTIAACEHFQDLYAIYGDWSLVLAAYNSGAGNVNRAIRRAGGTKNYWAIWPFLPRETRGYVPAFIAVTYVMNYAPEHNIYPMRPGMFFYDIDTVTVSEVLAFDQLNEMLGVPIEQLKFLNPQFKLGIIPATSDKNYSLRLPRQYVPNYLNNETELYAYKTRNGIEKDKLMAEVKKATDRSVHVVRSGENLGLIAKKYHVSVNQIRAWNNLKSNTIHPGQKLVVYGVGSSNYSTTKTETVVRSSEQSKHTVKSGENLDLIAKKYKCSVTDLKEWNNLKSSVIHPNQELVVYAPSSNNTVTDGKYVVHIVKKGDTLWDIARMYDGVTVDQIKKLNKLGNSSKLQVGQKLKITTTS
ncbi:MAG TPA: LysM peptidoglycan-binding domain-containing protein [Bacteroidales bacterium]